MPRCLAVSFAVASAMLLGLGCGEGSGSADLTGSPGQDAVGADLVDVQGKTDAVRNGDIETTNDSLGDLDRAAAEVLDGSDDLGELVADAGDVSGKSDVSVDTGWPQDLLDDGSVETADSLDLVAEDTLEVQPELPFVTFVQPESGSIVVASAEVAFVVQTNCFPGTAKFMADDQYLFGTLGIANGEFSYNYSFNTPGINRKITVAVVGPNGCIASTEVLLTIQPAFETGAEARTDSAGNPFTVHWARFPTADPQHNLTVAGSSSAKTVQKHGQSVDQGLTAINGGYFAAGQGPVSYAKGSAGYESPSGNVKGPRGCLWFDDGTREAGIEVSWGRQPNGGSWGDGLFPNASDVVCAGPVLVKDNVNVLSQQYESENFQTSGISPDSRLPRTAVCIMADQSILLIAAQNDSVKARGFKLTELADYFIAKGCTQALNLDGGGSTAFWSNTAPSGYWPGTEDRPVYNAVVVSE